MNFHKLNRLIFIKENPNNAYVAWDIGKEPTSSRYIFENINENKYCLIVKTKTRLDEMVHNAVFEYINNENLCNTQDSMFPRSDRLTGNFYIAEENYYSCENGIQGSILTHFTEMFCGGVISNPTEMDYLCLDVHFKIYGDGSIEITGIDSSSI